MTISHAFVIVRLDQKKILTQMIGFSPLLFWNPNFNMAIGNELTGERPWLGEVSTAIVEVEGQQWNCLNSELEIPSWYMVGTPEEKINGLTAPSLEDVKFPDLPLNFVCFIPIGFLIGTSYRQLTPLGVAGICVALSLGIELTQILFDGRFASIVDILGNGLGGGTGAGFAWLRFFRQESRFAGW